MKRPDFLTDLPSVDIFNVVEKLLTTAGLALVAITVGGQLGPMLGLHGPMATAAGWSIALVYDALWIGSLRMSELAIRQRSVVGMAVTLGLSAVAISVSTGALLVLGHAQVFAFIPLAAAAFMGLRLFARNVLADPATAAQIADQSAADRNARALAAADARHLQSEARTEVQIETAGHLAEVHRQAARAEVLTGAQKEISKVRAKAEETLAEADRKHGKKAAAFMSRELLTVGSRSAVTATGHAPAELDGHTVVTQVTPEIETATTPAATPDETDSVRQPESAPTKFTPTPEELALLDELAVAADVPRPQPGVTLSNTQLAVVIRWLRYTMEPPRSYRQAAEAFRDVGFQAREQRIRQTWDEIKGREKEVTAPTA
ncbi:hypothetical protein [Streptomyces erythrochromogenes]|uniref:hypothetical protein n=1 Tax=Streptomyces erythrochromogenes TaxID=285574 RepID=UPI00224F5BB7|nr:hypothetical protein [Streptomyces erythrochromogenes]MCX5584261.1 hypothetical protein [Streptomyces erythrochromogenes]